MELNYKNIFRICAISLLAALAYNYFNVNGINFLQNKKVYTAANDSLIHALTFDSIQASIKIDSVDLSSKNNLNEEQKNIKEIDTAKKEFDNSNQTEKHIQPQLDSQNEFSEPHLISLEQAYKLYLQKILFIDARNKNDYDYSHIKNSVSLPVFQFEDYKPLLETIQPDQPIVVYCNGPDCDMSDMLAEKLYELGYHKLFVFKGGWEEWENADYPSEPAREEIE